MRGRLQLALFAITFFGIAPLHGQSIPDSEVVISTDRPSVANSSVVVPQGGLQFENGLLVTHTQGQFLLDLPETNAAAWPAPWPFQSFGDLLAQFSHGS